ncbi:hypothetical protein BDY17DRAFT_297888 [Neohortaea acidophila]|uniref:Secreted protein n=1 Tax=Neohortaea acidophila TaxID=245834 RepID=A0A6A6PUK7_9PEZI|nr:uncharacterized protein BDY17DRAFT_297888 [Neohortaea acidophila]KAF2483682.1 hypothetical protein BDY17DRAFT_297888 [Neohortaea acidophila]
MFWPRAPLAAATQLAALATANALHSHAFADPSGAECCRSALSAAPSALSVTLASSVSNMTVAKATTRQQGHGFLHAPITVRDGISQPPLLTRPSAHGSVCSNVPDFSCMLGCSEYLAAHGSHELGTQRRRLPRHGNNHVPSACQSHSMANQLA